jgi:preprotein translocase subunit SecF
MTATTVFLALLSLAIFGGQVIRSFSLAMIWGLTVATYSSVFICSPMLIYLGLRGAGGEDDVVAQQPASGKSAAPAPAAEKTALLEAGDAEPAKGAPRKTAPAKGASKGKSGGKSKPRNA